MPKLTYLIDDKVYYKEELEEGAMILPANAPDREGFDFSSWNDLPEVMPADNLTVSAVYVPDSFVLTEIVDDEVWQTRTLQSGADLSVLPLPEKKGYSFSGWLKKYKKMPKSNLTLRGSFKINRYRLIFEVDDMLFERVVEYGASLDTIAVPERDNYTFSGWGKIPATMPDHDLRFSGSFQINTHTLTYLLDGKSYSSEKYTSGQVIKPATVETKAGYVFSGWRGLPKTMPDSDLTIEGRYYRKKSKITFEVDGKKYAWLALPIGERLVPPAPPVKEGAEFIEWRDLPDVVPDTDITVEAIFKSVE